MASHVPPVAGMGPRPSAGASMSSAPATARSRNTSKLTAASQAQNRAFVFIKPHALTEGVKDFVRAQLKAKASVVQEGLIEAEAIDRDMLVDRHYYAIASKATLLKPDKLPVPADKFQEKFGADWAETLRSGRALNARDACEALKVDASGLLVLWNKAKDANLLVKFGGGFYCAKIEPPHGGDAFFVFNGFFMAMRDKYVAKGAAIYYFLVDWSPMDTRWADFRSKVIGPTDPSSASPDSIRGAIFAKWQEFGLKSKPDMGDNGVHASASPVEGLFERLNWLGTSLEDDAFGARLLDNHVSAGLIEEWRRDPQVSFGRGAQKKQGSLYDALEDVDVDRCILRCKDIALTGRTYATVQKNRAFVFIKPHAVTPKVKALVSKSLAEAGIRIVQEGVVDAADIDQDMLVDKHYYAIASKATLLTPDKLPVPADKFKAKFGCEWADVLKDGSAINAKDACDKLGLTVEQLGTQWKKAQESDLLVKFGGGFYCGKVDFGDKGTFYVFNGFFMQMRSKFVKPGAEIYFYVAEWDPVNLPWADFRGSVLGPTDVAKAPASSIRGKIFAGWKDLGLAYEPNITDNGVHASASPVEALFERMNWLGTKLERDPFGKQLLKANISHSQVEEWSKDPQVVYGFGPSKGSFYDCLEDKDTDTCLEECAVIARVGHTPAVIRNSALIFIKPHAVTEATKKLVAGHLRDKGVDIVSEGSIDAAVIEAGSLIDRHCHAIASKAVLNRPEEVPAPGQAFMDAFGVNWDDAMKVGKVLNAKQACEKLRLDAAGLGKRWLEAKTAGDFLKVGDGYYIAKIEAPPEAEGGSASYYVLNGFFMEMRDKFTCSGASIHYFAVEWDPLDLSWADFRGQVLGSTDPSSAPEESLRGKIFRQWESLGLKQQPDIGDNGVHGSASPFQGLAERMNWLGVAPEEDGFGLLLLHSGVTKQHIDEWCLDPQVTFMTGREARTCSLYDALEDLDADRCVTQCQLLVGDELPEGDAEALEGEDAERLVKSGKVIGTSQEEFYEAFAFRYVVEEGGTEESGGGGVEASGRLWEVTNHQAKLAGCMAPSQAAAMWTARRLSAAETQQVLRRSPLTNRLPVAGDAVVAAA